MTQQEFIKAVLTIYEQARLVQLPGGIKVSEKIRRGRNHTVSGLIEDLFAHFLLQHFKHIDKILLDQCITFRDDQDKKYATYPDLMIIRNNKVRLIIDMKTDLGRKRTGLQAIVEKASREVNGLRGKTLTYIDGITKTPATVMASKELWMFIVVVSRENMNRKKLDEQLAAIASNHNISRVKVFFLTGGVHPNRSIYKGTQQNIQVLDEFEQLMNKIAKILVK